MSCIVRITIAEYCIFIPALFFYLLVQDICQKAFLASEQFSDFYQMLFTVAAHQARAALHYDSEEVAEQQLRSLHNPGPTRS